MEIAKFIFTAIGTFLSVFGLSFSIFQYWRKGQEQKFTSLKAATKDAVQAETAARQAELRRVEKRIDHLETTLMESIQTRLSSIEGELKSLKPPLQSIQNWFINNTPKG